MKIILVIYTLSLIGTMLMFACAQEHAAQEHLCESICQKKPVNPSALHLVGPLGHLDRLRRCGCLNHD